MPHADVELQSKSHSLNSSADFFGFVAGGLGAIHTLSILG
jgi:hypothetical protein